MRAAAPAIPHRGDRDYGQPAARFVGQRLCRTVRGVDRIFLPRRVKFKLRKSTAGVDSSGVIELVAA